MSEPTVSTASEDVERLAKALAIADQPITAATLRAIAKERDGHALEISALRLTLGGKTFDASVPAPIGCPMPGACSTVAEIVRLRTERDAARAEAARLREIAVTLRQHLALFCGPDDAIAKAIFDLSDAALAQKEPGHD